ncbi:16S rRNA (guanine(527)-N(7))-methyltransferase RsmG [Metamycoplasma hyosynoviae]|uniref:16S rRNA (guanine(527)-N(7))-methyltransferase RsmG n=1 Tax=Metamycoplasma hyosynoviae TaxID=29559 RepID=UPI002365A665|nr:16S rRNA (guanine(527)-N(7))-methyltransferase RsmG [Metamycoplasma hyosynoviae]MDD7897358.1 16S rRNA (guanine(527)-N(7))-methyltransferase RsmG [Metamycoplasma hyosynoviae]
MMLTETQTNSLVDKYLPNTSSLIKQNLYKYYTLIEEENQKYNLTGFYNEKLFCEGIIESILVFKEIETKICALSNKNILDIGSGVGFPSIPYFIYSNFNFNLFTHEPLGKRCNFLQLVKEKLNIKNLVIENIRTESSNEKEKFDFITARAVSELKNLIEISHHIGSLNSVFCFIKSNNYLNEINNASWIIKELDVKLETLKLEPFFTISNNLIYYHKTNSTPKNFPRDWAKIIKS